MAGSTEPQLTPTRIAQSLSFATSADKADFVLPGFSRAVHRPSNGVTIVDTKSPGWGQPIADAIKKLTDTPVRTIINTHTDVDHVSGNVEFPRGTDIVTHESNEAVMKRMAIFKENAGRGMPTRMYGQMASLSLDDDQVDLYYFGRGATSGDTWVVFPALGVAHAGDMFPGKSLPLLDAANGGSGVAIPDSLRKAARTLGGIDRIITGHGAVMTMAELEEYAEFNSEFMHFVDEAKLRGQTVNQIVASWKMPGQVQGIRCAATGEAPEQRAAHLRRAPVTDKLAGARARRRLAWFLGHSVIAERC